MLANKGQPVFGSFSVCLHQSDRVVIDGITHELDFFVHQLDSSEDFPSFEVFGSIHDLSCFSVDEDCDLELRSRLFVKWIFKGLDGIIDFDNVFVELFPSFLKL